MPDEVKLEPCAELVEALKSAARFNAPGVPGFRRVGFTLPEEIAWPKGKSAYDICDALLAVIEATRPIAATGQDMGEVSHEKRLAEGRRMFTLAAATLERDVLLHGLTEDEQNVLVGAVLNAGERTGQDDVVKELVEAARALTERKSATFRARNGREVGIQGDDGEMCWLVHSDEMNCLETALARTGVTLSEQN